MIFTKVLNASNLSKLCKECFLYLIFLEIEDVNLTFEEKTKYV